MLLPRPRSAPRSAPHRAGFTLMELVLVLVIVCTMLAIAAPSLRGFSTARKTDDAAGQLVSIMHWARAQSITEAKVYRLNIDTNNRVYFLSMQEGGLFQDLGTEFGRRFEVTDDIRIDTDAPRAEGWQVVRFYPTGRTEAATIRLTDASNKTVQIGCLSPTEMYHILTPEELSTR
jgi:type II secretion system protein H